MGFSEIDVIPCDALEYSAINAISAIHYLSVEYSGIQFGGFGESSQESLPLGSQLEHPAHFTIHISCHEMELEV